MCDPLDPQARVDKLFADPLTPDSTDMHKRLLTSARRGINDPSSLSAKETRDICLALVVHYAQMGIA